MALTGFILWFPAQAMKIFPWWAVTASQTIHYYEAWLATLAIIVWHFFFVIFHPEEYPMNWTWLTGRMSEHSVKHHHARWYEDEIAAPTEPRENRADTEL
jgi:cytochrome b subunit of formate dehydrogenase